MDKDHIITRLQTLLYNSIVFLMANMYSKQELMIELGITETEWNTIIDETEEE